MAQVENELVRDAFQARLQITAALAGGMMGVDPKHAIDLPKSTLDSYLGLTLPYQFKKTKIKQRKVDPVDKKQLAEMLKKKTQALTNG